MISYAEAVGIICGLARARLAGVERVPLAACVGRIAAETMSGSGPIPPFDNSAMDGFALHADSTAGASPERPVTLRVIGSVAAGDSPFPAVQGHADAVEIMTGAALPEGMLDAVAKIEEVRPLRDAAGRLTAVEVSRRYAPGEFVRRRGADFMPGQTVVAAGTRLGPEQILGLAAVGATSVPVRRRLRAALISTGNELVDATALELRPGQIRNATTPFLLASLPLYGMEAELGAKVPDEPQRFIDCVKELLARSPDRRPDVILSTGAVSMGKHDFIPSALEKLDACIRLHRVAVQPGRPLLVADWPSLGPAGPVLFGIPGNPISTAVGLRFFVAPFLRVANGLPAEIPTRLSLAADVSKSAGLRSFYKAQVEVDSGNSRVTVLTGQASFMISPLLRANAWAVLPEAPASVARGTEVEVLPLHPGTGFALES